MKWKQCRAIDLNRVLANELKYAAIKALREINDLKFPKITRRNRSSKKRSLDMWKVDTDMNSALLNNKNEDFLEPIEPKANEQ